MEKNKREAEENKKMREAEKSEAAPLPKARQDGSADFDRREPGEVKTPCWNSMDTLNGKLQHFSAHYPGIKQLASKIAEMGSRGGRPEDRLLVQTIESVCGDRSMKRGVTRL